MSGTSGTPSRSPTGAGLQAERTGLAWSRTALGAGANAVLLAVREIGHGPPGRAAVPAALALLLAVTIAIYAQRRTARLRRAPLPEPVAARRAIPLLGTAVAVLALVSGWVLLL